LRDTLAVAKSRVHDFENRIARLYHHSRPDILNLELAFNRAAKLDDLGIDDGLLTP
jgi:hypothetical protein